MTVGTQVKPISYTANGVGVGGEGGEPRVTRSQISDVGSSHREGGVSFLLVKCSQIATPHLGNVE
jgi:hypothetical protein